MTHNDIEDMLKHLRRIKSEGGLNNHMTHRIVVLEAALRLSRTFIKYHHVLLPDCLVEITEQVQLIRETFHSAFAGNIDKYRTIPGMSSLHLEVSWLLKFIEGNTTLWYSYELNASYLSEYMDCLGANLNDVLLLLEFDERHALEFNRFLKQVKIVQKKLGFLRYFYVMEINGNVNRKKVGLEARIQFLADNVGQCCLLCMMMLVQPVMLRNGIFLVQNEGILVQKIFSKLPYLLCLAMVVQLEMQSIFLGELKASKFCQSKTFKYRKFPKDFSDHLHCLLMYLRNTKFENFLDNVSSRNMDGVLEFLLCFLADVPKCLTDDKMLNEVLEKVGAIVGDVLYVIQKLLPSSIIKDDTSKTNLYLIQIVEETENLKAQVEKYYKSLKFTHSHEFPTVGGLIFLDSLLRKLNEIMKSEFTLGFMVKPHIGNLEKELSSLTYFFKDVAKVHHEHNFFKDRQRRTINLAYEVEVSIDSILAQCNSLWHIFCSLPAILKEIKHINEEVTKMSLENLPLKLCSVVEQSTHLPTPYIDPLTDEEIVGFENDAEKIIQYLIRGTKDRDVIPIVGMGGQGKTTVARKVYNNSRIMFRFDVRVWCCISQTYSPIELLREMFNQVRDPNDKPIKDDKLADMLRKSLIGKRYLIVLDDMWDVMAWENLRLSFPDTQNGSRIIVTTRELEKVAEQIKQYTDPYSLPFLAPQESSELLQKKVFQKERFPPELQDVSLQVAERCKGLPLAVVLVAGIIKRKKKMEASWWLEVKETLHSYLDESEEYSTLLTMQFSYDYLPDYLRPCFLYMGMFPEDARVPVEKLINLWIAEGFIQNIGSGRLEEEAEGYLMDLISSNMVMVSKRTCNGKVKYCQVHDIVLHFCMEMSRKEKFMPAVKGHYSQFKPCDWKVSRLIFNFTDELSEIALLVPKTRNPFHQQLRSLITTVGGAYYDWNPFPKVRKLGLLRVLDLSSHQLDPFSTATLNPLIHLKYLAIFTSDFEFHPESLLLNLETMILRAHNVSLPAIFWKMEKLRHVEIDGAIFDWKTNQQQIMEESSQLKNLRILRLVEFHGDDVDQMDVLFEKCPNLQELEIWVYEDSADICTCLSLKSESLTHLIFHTDAFLSELHFPSNLKKLVLIGPDLVTPASLIAGLTSLEYLRLENLDVQESDSSEEDDMLEEWCLGDITFGQLKFLKLVGLGISRWDASEASFPILETLVIKFCHRLKKIPPSFADIQTLKQIKLLGCNKSLRASALEIKKEVEEIAGCIDVIIDGKLVHQYEDLFGGSEECEEESEEEEESQEFGNI